MPVGLLGVTVIMGLVEGEAYRTAFEAAGIGGVPARDGRGSWMWDFGYGIGDGAELVSWASGEVGWWHMGG